MFFIMQIMNSNRSSGPSLVPCLPNSLETVYSRLLFLLPLRTTFIQGDGEELNKAARMCACSKRFGGLSLSHNQWATVRSQQQQDERRSNEEIVANF